MPTYNYRCGACGHEFERVQRITEDPIRTCPGCNAEAASRLITSGNFILRGSGWYSDLYSGGSNKKGGASASASTSDSSSTSTPSSSESSGGGGGCGAPACATSCAGGSSTSN